MFVYPCNMNILIVLIYTYLLSSNVSHSHEEVLGVNVLKNEVYGPYKRNKIDVFFPSTRVENAPAILLIHGGAWIVGSKSTWPSSIIKGLVEQGYVVVSMNYRFACGDFKKQMEDVQMAVNFIHEKRRTWKIAADKLGLAGVSAGGHMALLFAQAYDSSHLVKAVVSLAGPTDLTDTLFRQYLHNYCLGFVLKKFLGASLKDNRQLYVEASPIFHSQGVPCLFINGQNDNLVPAEQAFRMYDSLRLKEIVTDTILLSNTGHYIYGKKNVNIDTLIKSIVTWMGTFLR